MWAVLLVALEAAPPPDTAVVVFFPGRQSASGEISRRVLEALAHVGLEPSADRPEWPRDLRARVAKCAGAAACLGAVAAQLEVRALIDVEVNQVADVTAGHLEALDRAGTLLSSADFTAQGGGYLLALDVALPAFAKVLAARLTEKREPAAVEAPPPKPAETVLPVVVAPPPAPTVETSSSKRPLGIGALAVGAAALVGAGVFLGLGVADLSTFNGHRTTVDGRSASTLTRTQLDALAASGNTRFDVAGGLGLVAAALLITAVVMLMN